jgi:MYXO-CTERM domain-containing protein
MSEAFYSMCLPGGRLLRRSIRGPQGQIIETAAPAPEAGDPLAGSPAFVVGLASPGKVLDLRRDRGYRLAVVAIDSFSNATSSDEVHIDADQSAPEPEPTPTPTPTPEPTPASTPMPGKGGCSVSRGAGDGLAGLALTLAALAWALRRRRTH